MKISKIFHWLYLSIMVLPLLVIPIFAINIVNRSPEPISVVVDDTETTYSASADIQYQYKYQTNEVNSINDLVLNNVYEMEEFSLWSDFQEEEGVIDYVFTLHIFNGSNMHLSGTWSATKTNGELLSFSDLVYSCSGDSAYLYYADDNEFSFGFYADLYSVNTDFWGLNVTFCIVNGLNDFKSYIDNYGASLPSSSAYNVIESATATASVVETTTGTTTTYNDTDIGSQFLYTTYHVTNKYFNFSEVPILNDFGDWFVTDVFNNDVPLACYIIYDFACYWLLISIFWLMFDVMIYVPLLIHHYLDKAEVS